MTRYILSQEARNDLQEIKSYIAQDSLEPVRRVLAEFRQAFRELARMPGMEHPRKDLTKQPVLFWPVRSCLVIYRPDAQPPEIVAVLHGKRDLKRVLRSSLLRPRMPAHGSGSIEATVLAAPPEVIAGEQKAISVQQDAMPVSVAGSGNGQKLRRQMNRPGRVEDELCLRLKTRPAPRKWRAPVGGRRRS